MDTTITHEDNQATLSVTLSNEEMEKHFAAAAREASQNMSVKGFRPGNVPYETVAKTIGEDALLQKVVERAVSTILPQLYEKHGLEPIGEPQVTIKKIAKGNPFEFDAVVPVLPDITVPALDDLSAERRAVSVSDEEIDHALEHLARSRAKRITVDRPAQQGDRVEIDFTLRADGAKIEDGESQNHPITIGDGKYVPGFEDELVGLRAGDDKEFELDVPEDYGDKRIAGRRLHASVTMKLVQEEEAPEITDTFAQSLGTFSSLEELRESVVAGLRQEKEQKEDQRVRIDLIEQVAEKIDVDIPPVLIERELRGMKEEFERNIAGMGLDFGEYLKHLDKQEEDLMEDWQPEATKRVRIGLALHAIAEDQGIEPDAQVVEERVNETLKRYGDVEEAREKIDMKRLQAYTRSVVLNEAVLNYLVENATITTSSEK